MSHARKRFKHRKATIITLFAMFLPVLLLLSGFSLMVAWSQLVRTELRTAHDFAARAGAKRLSLDQDGFKARQATIDAASRNFVAGRPFRIQPSDVTLGVSKQINTNTKFQFAEGGSRLGSVKVNARLQADDPVSKMLIKLAGVNSASFSNNTVATLLDRDISVVIDISGSMGLDITYPFDGNGQNEGPMGLNTRFAALASAIHQFAKELNDTPQQERVCFTAYSSSSTLMNTLSDSTVNITGPVEKFMRDGIGGGTAIGMGLSDGIRGVLGTGSRSFAVPTIVLMTDGNHNTGISPESVVSQAIEKNITVHTITFSPAANQSSMKSVAKSTGGLHFHANSLIDLTESFREIARTLPVMLTQ